MQQADHEAAEGGAGEGEDPDAIKIDAPVEYSDVAITVDSKKRCVA